MVQHRVHDLNRPISLGQVQALATQLSMTVKSKFFLLIYVTIINIKTYIYFYRIEKSMKCAFVRIKKVRHLFYACT